VPPGPHMMFMNDQRTFLNCSGRFGRQLCHRDGHPEVSDGLLRPDGGRPAEGAAASVHSRRREERAQHQRRTSGQSHPGDEINTK
jgi:hypothetical protein